MRWTVLPLLVALTACVTPPPEAPEKPPEQKVEQKVEEGPKTPAPKIDVPAKQPSDLDCSKVEFPDVDLATLTPMTLPEGANPALTDPSKATEQAPETFKVKFTTTKGDFVIQAYRPWAPKGVDRFYNLVKIGFYDNVKFFRALDGFMTQFGLSAYPEVNAAWRGARIKDDKVKQGNVRGVVTYAMGGPNTRTSQLFINTNDNSRLDGDGFSGFGVVVEGMEVVDSLYTCYGEGQPRGRGPNQGAVQQIGNAYLDAAYPKLDGIIKAEIIEE